MQKNHLSKEFGLICYWEEKLSTVIPSNTKGFTELLELINTREQLETFCNLLNICKLSKGSVTEAFNEAIDLYKQTLDSVTPLTPSSRPKALN
jgi:hypothetical protein